MNDEDLKYPRDFARVLGWSPASGGQGFSWRRLCDHAGELYYANRDAVLAARQERAA